MKLFSRKKLLIAALVPAFGMPIALSSHAQNTMSQGSQTGQSQTQAQGQQGTQKQQQGQGQQARKIRDMRASQIVGANVQSKQGKDLGEIQDLIVNADDGRVNYAIVAFGGMLGFGEKLFAYPMDRFQASTSGNELVLNASEQQMKNAPGFDRSQWPSFGRDGYRGEVDKHFGKTAKAGGNLVRMSEMLSKNVVDRAGNEVGQIEDVVVSVTNGKVRYVALEPDNDLNIGDRLVMLPMNAIRATGSAQMQNRQQSQASQSGRSQQQSQGDSSQSAQSDQHNQPGQPQQQAQMSGKSQQQESGQRQQAQQSQNQDLRLVLNVQPKQLEQAKRMEQDKWPDLNNRAFQNEMDKYVASFPSGGKGGTASGASGTQGKTQSGASDSTQKQNSNPSQHSSSANQSDQRQSDSK